MRSRRLLLLLALAAGLAAFHLLDLGRFLTLEALKSNRDRLEEFRAANAFLSGAVFVAVYVAQTLLCLPGAAVLTMAAGAVFGIVQGTLLSVAGATGGALLGFLAARTLAREWAARMLGRRMEAIDRGLREDGLSYLLFLRLVPLFPFFLVNLACGITGIPFRTYAVGTVFGIIPGSLLFVNAGASLAAVESVRQVLGPRVLGSFALLGLFALLPAIARAVKRRREGRAA